MYVGLDFSIPLLRDTDGLPGNFLFIEADLAGDWESRLLETTEPRPRAPEEGGFDLVTAFAVLHHLPGSALRRQLIGKVYQHLRPGGRFIHSNWQFLNSPRLRTRLQSWEGIGLSSTEVDEQDYLLDWRRGGEGLRYVHYFDENELNTLALEGGFRVLETFHADGENNALGIYQIWKK